MKAILQRVKQASVSVDGQVVSQIGRGILVLAAVGQGDSAREIEGLAGKIVRLRLWDDAAGAKWKQSVKDIDGEILCVSQFTLLASTKKGNKPDFHRAAGGTRAKELYDDFVARVRALYRPERVQDGVFQAMMDVALINDGPVTIQIDVDPPLLSTSASTPSTSASASTLATASIPMDQQPKLD